MTKTLKRAISDKWLLVLNEYELIKQKKSKNFKTVIQLCQVFKVHRKDIRKYTNAGLKLVNTEMPYCLGNEVLSLANISY
jgi:hypothetical protein